MTGFKISYQPDALPKRFGTLDLADMGIRLDSSGIAPIVTRRNNVALVDGYILGYSQDRLIDAFEERDDAFLARAHGSYCALIIGQNGDMQGFCDRIGARTLFWQSSPQSGITIASRWEQVPLRVVEWDAVGLSETLRYRWTSGERTQIRGVGQLPIWHRVLFRRNGEISLQNTIEKPKYTRQLREPLRRRKVDETRSALATTLSDMAQHHENAAVYLSGGVDSALLAAMAKPCFRKLLLVTPVFPGEANPELPTAKEFAGALHLEHLMVDVDPERLELDLRALVRAKGGQVNYLLLPMHQMNLAIPDDYELVIYGLGGDTLFGSGQFKRVESLLHRKAYVDRVSTTILELLSRVPNNRIRGLCRLKRRSVADIVLHHLRIKYDADALTIIDSISNADLNDIYANRALLRCLRMHNNKLDHFELRGLLQDIAFASEGANHAKETELSATLCAKKVFVPYMSEPVQDAASTLTKEQYFGIDYVKPVLRELACEHFDRKLIYQRKYGFDVPYLSWLKGPLVKLVDSVKSERELFAGELLKNLDLESHHALFWTLINWQIDNENIRAELQGRR